VIEVTDQRCWIIYIIAMDCVWY